MRRRWLSRAALDVKLVRRVQSRAAGSDQSQHKVVVAAADSLQLGERVASVVESDLGGRQSVNLGEAL